MRLRRARQPGGVGPGGRRPVDYERVLLEGSRALMATEAGDWSSLDQVIDQVASHAPYPPEVEVSAFLVMAGALGARFRRDGRSVDLDMSVDLFDRAAESLPADDLRLPFVLSRIATALLTRYTHAGLFSDLTRSVRCARRAVEVCPPSDPRRADRLTGLAQSLHEQFDRAGEIHVIDEAVAMARAAVEVGGPDPARYHSALSGALRARYAARGRLEDIDGAVTSGRAAADIACLDDGDRACLMLANLGHVLQVRYERTEDPQDLHTAIDCLEQAVIRSREPRVRARQLSALAAALTTRARRSLVPLADLVRADGLLSEADALAEAGPDREAMRVNRAETLRTLAEVSGSADDARRAVELAAEAARTMPPEGSRAAQAALVRGLALRAQARLEPHAVDRRALVTAASTAAHSDAAQPDVRAAAWGLLAEAYAEEGRRPAAIEAYREAIDLLARVGGQGATRVDQEHWLSGAGHLASDAVAICLDSGLPEQALELGERGRGVLLRRALDQRAEFRDLAQVAPDLAGRLTRATATLRSDERRILPGQRRAAGTDFDDALEAARGTPGFEGLLRPVAAVDLCPAAESGPVVVVNVSRFRSDALIVQPDGVRVVSLPGVTPELVRDQVQALHALLADVRRRQRVDSTMMTSVLRWLWDEVAGPVIEALEASDPIGGPSSTDGLPRVHWCPSGLMGLLPLHAAEHRGTGRAGDSVLDHVVSSYTPTVAALLTPRRGQQAVSSGVSDPALLVVAMPHTPDEPDLPAAAREAALITRLHPDAVVLSGEAATFESVAAAIHRTRWAHFACHATSDPTSPGSGRLLLSDHRSRPLTARDVSGWDLQEAEFAYLSACATAHRDVRLSDEALPLATCFQLAGFRHVIGTMWPVGDRMAAKVASSVYRELSRRDASAAPWALHQAVCELRDAAPRSSFGWGSFIAAGA